MSVTSRLLFSGHPSSLLLEPPLLVLRFHFLVHSRGRSALPDEAKQVDEAVFLKLASGIYLSKSVYFFICKYRLVRLHSLLAFLTEYSTSGLFARGTASNPPQKSDILTKRGDLQRPTTDWN